jgi:hypothetical protein
MIVITVIIIVVAAVAAPVRDESIPSDVLPATEPFSLIWG